MKKRGFTQKISSAAALALAILMMLGASPVVAAEAPAYFEPADQPEITIPEEGEAGGETPPEQEPPPEEPAPPEEEPGMPEDAETPPPAEEPPASEAPQEPAEAPAEEALSPTASQTVEVTTAAQLADLTAYPADELTLRVAGNLALTGSLVVPAGKSVTLRGRQNGVILTRGAGCAGHMVQVEAGGTLWLDNITLDGAGTGTTGAIVYNAGSLHIAADNGTARVVLKGNVNGAGTGGVHNAGSFTMRGGEISGNSGTNGWHIRVAAGGVLNAADCNFQLYGGSIKSNYVDSQFYSDSAGGLYNAGITTVMGNSTTAVAINENAASSGAGGVYNTGDLTLSKTPQNQPVTVSKNIITDGFGACYGGIYSSGILNMAGVSVTENNVRDTWSNRAGITVAGGSMTMLGGTITGNYQRKYNGTPVAANQLYIDGEQTALRMDSSNSGVTIGDAATGLGLLMASGKPVTLIGNLANSTIVLEPRAGDGPGTVLANKTSGSLLPADIACFIYPTPPEGTALMAHANEPGKLILGLGWAVTGSLQQQIEDAAATSAESPATITVPAGGVALSQPLYIQSVQVGQPRHIILTGGPLKRAAGYTGNLVQVPAGSSLVLQNITLNGAKGAAGDGLSRALLRNLGATTLKSGAVLENNAASTGDSEAGAILNQGTLAMEAGAVIRNNSYAGSLGSGGVFNSQNGVFTMAGGEFAGNVSGTDQPNVNGRGGAVRNSGSFTMSGGTMRGNRALGEYGSSAAIYNSKTLTISGGTIGGANTADANIGSGQRSSAIGNEATLNLFGGVIRGNGGANVYDISLSGQGAINLSGAPVVGTPQAGGISLNNLIWVPLHITEAGLAAGASLNIRTIVSDVAVGAILADKPTDITEAELASFSYISDDFILGYGPYDRRSITLHGTAQPAGLQALIDAASAGTAENPVEIAIPANTELAATLQIQDSRSLQPRHVVFTGGPLKRAAGFAGFMVSVGRQSSLTLREVTLDGRMAPVTTDQTCVVDNWGTLNMAAGAKLVGGTMAGWQCAAVQNLGTFNMAGGSIEDTAAQSAESGAVCAVYNYATFNLSGGSIMGNSGNAGGVRNEYGSTFNMTGGSVTRNTGHGVYNATYASFTMSGGSISGNTGAPQLHSESDLTLSGSAVIGTAGGTGLSLGSEARVRLGGALDAGAFVRLDATGQDAPGREMALREGGVITAEEWARFSYSHTSLQLARDAANLARLVLSAKPAAGSLQARIDAATGPAAIEPGGPQVMDSTVLIAHSASLEPRSITLKNSSLTRGAALDGDLVLVPAGSSLTLEASTLVGRAAAGTGSLLVNHGRLTADAGSALTSNSSTGGAGALYNTGTATLNGTEVTGNTCGTASGINNFGRLWLNGARVEGNSGSIHLRQQPGASLTLLGAVRVGSQNTGGIALPATGVVPLQLGATLPQDAGVYLLPWAQAAAGRVIAHKPGGTMAREDLDALHYTGAASLRLAIDPENPRQIILRATTLQDRIDEATGGTPEEPVVISQSGTVPVDATLVIADSASAEPRHIQLEGLRLQRAEGFSGDLIQVPAGSSLVLANSSLDGGSSAYYDSLDPGATPMEATGVLLRNFGTVVHRFAHLQYNYTSSLKGGALYNAGSYTVEDATRYFDNSISYNSAKEGGGIYNAIGGRLYLGNALVMRENQAINGGAIYNAAGEEDAPGLVMNGNVNLTSNSATQNGGGVYNAGAASLAGTLQNNRAGGRGSGLYAHGQGSHLVAGNLYCSNDVGVGGVYLHGNAQLAVNTAANPSLFFSFEPVDNARAGRVMMRAQDGGALDVSPDRASLYYLGGGYRLGQSQPELVDLAPYDLQTLIDNATAGTAEAPVDILLEQPVTLTEPLVIAHSATGQARHVRIYTGEDFYWEISIQRGAGLEGDMIRVPAGSSLALEQLRLFGPGAAYSGDEPDPSPATASGPLLNNQGAASLKDVELRNNVSTGSGGAIRNSGSLTALRCNITDCGAEKGGGIYNTGRLEMTYGDIYRCLAGQGGCLYNAGPLVMNGGYLEDSPGSSQGSGLYQAAGAALTLREYFDGRIWLAGTPAGRSPILLDDTPIEDPEYDLYFHLRFEGIENPDTGEVLAQKLNGQFTQDEADAYFHYFGVSHRLALSEGKLVLEPRGPVSLQTLINEAANDYGDSFTIQLPQRTLLEETLHIADTRGDAYSARSIRFVGGTLARAPGFTGSLIQVGSHSQLVLEGTTLDGSPGAAGDVVDSSLVVNGYNGELILREGAVLKNNQIQAAKANYGARGAGVFNMGKVTLEGGQITGNGFAQVITGTESMGGGIYSESYYGVELRSGAIHGNSANQGGGIYLASYNYLNMSGGAITGNTANQGGGVYSFQGRVAIQGGIIGGDSTAAGNQAGSGGGLYLRLNDNSYGSEVDLTLLGGAIKGNRATDGGGIYGCTAANYQAPSKNQMLLYGGAISGNSATGSGGGIYLEHFRDPAHHPESYLAVSRVALLGTGLSGNSAGAAGGGLYASAGSIITHSAGAISGNSAKKGGGVANHSSGALELPGYSLSGTGTVNGNSATGTGAEGGGLYNTGTARLSGGSIQNNSTAGKGADVYYASAENTLLELERGAVVGSQAGGLYLAGTAPHLTLCGNLNTRAEVALEQAAGHTIGTVVARSSGHQLTESTAAAFTCIGHHAVQLDADANTLVLTRAQYRLFYDAGAGAGAPVDNALYDPGATVTLSEALPTRTGYNFTGWNTRADGSGSAYAPGQAFTIQRSTVLYAQWQAKSWSIRYLGLVAPGSQNNPDSYTYGAGFVLQPPLLAPSGQLFSGWVDDDTNQPVTRISATQTGELTLRATWQVDNSSVPVTGISLAPESLTLLLDDAPTRISAALQPANATNRKLVWSSSAPGIAQVDAGGWVTPLAAGSAVITATTADGGLTASCPVKVWDGFAGLRFEKDGAPLTDLSYRLGAENQNLDLAALVANSVEGFEPKTLLWHSSKAAVAAVDKNGLLTPKAAGTAVIRLTASQGEVSHVAVLSVRVLPRDAEVSSVLLNTHEAKGLKTGRSLQLRATVAPKAAPLRQLEWAVEDHQPQAGLAAGTPVAAVNQSGKVSLLNPGAARVVVRVTDFVSDTVYTDSCTIEVARPVTGVALAGVESPLRLPVGQAVQLQALVAPADATVQTVTWKSSNSKAATVEDGLVTAANAPGTTTISAITTDGRKTAKLKVTVYRPVSALSFSAPPASLARGKTARLKPAWANGTPSNPKLSWTTSDPYTATVDKNGTVKALRAGTVNITATSAENAACSATATLAVTTPVTALKIDQKPFTLGAGTAEAPGRVKLSATVNGGEPLAPGYQGLKWTVSPAGMLAFEGGDEAGYLGASPVLVAKPEALEAAGLAKTTVSVTVETVPADKEKKRSVSLKITLVPGTAKALERVTVTNYDKRPTTEAPLPVGGSYKPAITTAPKDAANKNLLWTISPTGYAALDGVTGAVKGLRPSGDEEITVRGVPLDAAGGAEEIVYSFKVAQRATGVALQKSASIRADGQPLVLTASLLPATASSQAVSWTWADPKGAASLATLADGSLEVRGVKAGSLTVTATAADGSKKKASCRITVAQQVLTLAISPPKNKDGTPKDSLDKGKTLTLKAVLNQGLPAPKNRKLSWESLDPAIASVNKNGVVKGLAGGVATIRATAADGGIGDVYRITVKVPATSVKHNQKKFSIQPGRTVVVGATTTPLSQLLTEGEAALSWESSNDEVLLCTPQAGGTAKLTALAAGKATVTVTTARGKRAQLAVTVSTDADPATGVAMEKSATWLAVKKSETLKATVAPASAGNKNLHWSIEQVWDAKGNPLPASRAGEVLTLSAAGKVTATGAGSARVVATTVDGGKQAGCLVYCVTKS